MKQIVSLLFIVCIYCMCSCSDKEIAAPEPTPTPVPTPTPGEENDSVYYSLGVADYEIVASSRNKLVAFMEKDTLFDFRCLFDSCQNSRLTAYCDSTGIVERICIGNKVFDFLYHTDRSKLDILYQKDGKLELLQDIENPLRDNATRMESGDVPYSSIQMLSYASYAIYMIINSYPLVFSDVTVNQLKYMKKFATPPYESKKAIELIYDIYGKEYGMMIGNHYTIIASVMKEYATWVKGQLYGKAIPLARQRAERTGINDFNLYAYVNDAEEDKQDFQVGIIIREEGNQPFDNLHNDGNGIKKYNASTVFYECAFVGKPTGRKYKYKAYLAPLSSSKYMEGIKCLIDYYQYGATHTFDLLEAQGELLFHENDRAFIELSAETIDRNAVKMGLYYGTNPELPESERMKLECDVEFKDYVFSEEIVKQVELNNLVQDTTYYYIPYIIYDGNIINRPLEDGSIGENASDIITEKDRVFCGIKQSFETKNIKIQTMGDNYEKPVLTLMGYYNPEKYQPKRLGFCYSTSNSAPTLSNQVIEASMDDEGDFLAIIPNTEINKTYYYRAFMIIDNHAYYGDVVAASTEEPKEALIVGEWDRIYYKLKPFVSEEDEEEYGKIPDWKGYTSSMSIRSDHSFGGSGFWRMPSARSLVTYIQGLGEGDDDEGWGKFKIKKLTRYNMHLQIHVSGLYKMDAIFMKLQR